MSSRSWPQEGATSCLAMTSWRTTAVLPGDPDGEVLCVTGGYMGTHWGNIRVMWGLRWDNGKENGEYYAGFMGCSVQGLDFFFGG